MAQTQRIRPKRNKSKILPRWKEVNPSSLFRQVLLHLGRTFLLLISRKKHHINFREQFGTSRFLQVKSFNFLNLALPRLFGKRIVAKFAKIAQTPQLAIELFDIIQPGIRPQNGTLFWVERPSYPFYTHTKPLCHKKFLLLFIFLTRNGISDKA